MAGPFSFWGFGMVDTAANIWRNYITDGVAASGAQKPDKREIREWGTYLESLATLAFTSSLVYSTRAALYANLVPAANVPALVIGDPTAGYDGLYMKVGATTTGSWTRLGDVPGRQYIKATDAGAGTANAIVATTDIPLPSADRGAIITLNIYEANTATPVTVAFNGGSALTIKTANGADVSIGAMSAGAVVAGYVSGSTFRLLSEGLSLPAPEAYKVLAWDATGTVLENRAVDGTDAMLAAVYDPQNKAADAFDAVNIDYLSDGTGAVERSVRAKLREVKSVLDFGAVGDCSAVSTGTDDSAAIQLAFDWLTGGACRHLIFPGGYRFRVSATCTADFGHINGPALYMFSPITPDPGIGNAFEFIDARNCDFRLYALQGGQTADYTQADPAGADQAFYIRGLRDAEISVKALGFKGRVVRCTEEQVGEFKTSKITFPYFHTEAVSLSERCGQAIYVDCSSAFGCFVSPMWFYDEYGPVFYETHDIIVLGLDSGLWDLSGIVIAGCLSFWANTLSTGDGGAPALVKITNGATVNVGNIHIGAIFAQLVAIGVHLEDLGTSTTVPGVSIGAIKTISNTAHGVYMDTCRGVKFYLDSVNDEIALETTGACSNCNIEIQTLNTEKQVLIIGATAFQMKFTGNIANANTSATASTSAIDINTTGRGIIFRDMDITTANADYMYDAVASNNVVILGGTLLKSGSTAVMGANHPLVVRDVRGWRTLNESNATILSGNTSVTVNHGLGDAAVGITPGNILLTGYNSAEVDEARAGSATSTQFTITVPAAVTADRQVYWRASRYQSQA